MSSSATIPWPEFDIDKCIVIPDFEAEVTGDMLYIRPNYTTERGVRTVKINHTDGSGMIDPNATIIPEEIRGKNFMFRGPYHKGLLSPFPWKRFCSEKGVKPVIKDFWGKEHDLIAEDIQILFTESQFKLAKLYKDWDEFKYYYRKCNCCFCIAQFEDDWLQDKQYNYQMMQTLTDITDEEIQTFTAKVHERLLNLTTNQHVMLETLNAKKDSSMPDKVALALYPELLRDGYSRSQMKDIKKRMLFDARSAAIKCTNKRLYAIPDFYAACEHWFLGIKNPKGLLAKDEVGCKLFRKYELVDVLRSPHLFMEHSINKVSQNPEIYRWLSTNGIYTSVKSLISRILQFDNDGDQLNVVGDETIISVAKRNIEKYDVVPLFYDATKAAAEQVSKVALFNGLKRAHLYSDIGEISNMLTRLWNRDNPDREAAALLVYVNNLRIDGAKCGAVNEYTNYPEVKKKIDKATGGLKARMPYFFQFSKNGRRDETANYKNRRSWALNNNSTMNRICAMFNDIGNINMNLADVNPFNWQMMLSEECLNTRTDIVNEFCDLDNIKVITVIDELEEDFSEKDSIDNNCIHDEYMIHVLTEKFGSLEECYPYIVKHLFSNDGLAKSYHKQTFWRVFGNIAVEKLSNNLANFSVCPVCNAKIPSWTKTHLCNKNGNGYYTCIDCGKLCMRTGSKQQRCENCQKLHESTVRNANKRENRKRKKEREKEFISFLASQNK